MDLWDLSRRNPSEKPFKLAAHDTTVEDFAFSPDQKFLLSVGRDRAIIKWDLGTSDPSGNWVFLQSPRDVQYLGHTHLFGVDSPDSILAVATEGSPGDQQGQYTQIDRWIFDISQLFAGARSRVARNLTQAEWGKYFGNTPCHRAFEAIPGCQ